MRRNNGSIRNALLATNTRRRGLQWIGGIILLGIARFNAHAADNNNDKKRKVLLFTKSSGFEHDTVKKTGSNLSLSEKTLTEIGKKRGFEIVATKDGRVFEGDLTQYDAFFFFTTGDLTETGTDKSSPMSAGGKDALLASIQGGKGFVGVHSASDTFHSKGNAFATQEKADPYIAMLGGEFVTHGQQQEAYVKVVDRAFPGLQDIGDRFKITEEWYSLKNFRQDIHVLLILETDGMQGSEYKRPPFPLAWARREGKGRVYFNAMGHRDDVWTSERFQEMLAGAIDWAAGGTQAELEENMSKVTPQAWVLPPEN